MSHYEPAVAESVSTASTVSARTTSADASTVREWMILCSCSCTTLWSAFRSACVGTHGRRRTSRAWKMSWKALGDNWDIFHIRVSSSNMAISRLDKRSCAAGGYGTATQSMNKGDWRAGGGTTPVATHRSGGGRRPTPKSRHPKEWPHPRVSLRRHEGTSDGEGESRRQNGGGVRE